MNAAVEDVLWADRPEVRVDELRVTRRRRKQEPLLSTLETVAQLPAEGVTSALAFAELGLSPEMLRALDDVGYDTPSPVQAQTIPALLAGSDVVTHAQTGTGKTAAFAVPIVERIDRGRPGPQAVVLTPTRELAGC